MGIVIKAFIIPASDMYLALTAGQRYPEFYVDDLTDFLMRWALARSPFYKEEIEAWSD